MDDHNKNTRIKRFWPWIGAGVILLFGLWQLVTSPYVEEEKALRSQVRKTVMEKFPELAEDFSQTIGLFPFTENRKIVAGDAQIRNVVVLIHGLDDPGRVWQNLAPQLAQAGSDVWLMNYPNDQPIVESTLLFFEELKSLRQHGISRVSIVAHSMGGLISRDLLTNPEIAYMSQAKQDEVVPQVERLIMIGTPNHGSQMARLRFFSEVRDHFDRLIKGQFNGLGFILDGAGEAKIDLLPGSLFLTELNKRPPPEGVDMLIIAGISAPWSDDDIDNMLRDIGQKVGEVRAQEVQKIGIFMKSMSNGLGDGLVTLESAMLPGVPYLTVSGTHLSMIRNISRESKRVPPAVPIVVNQLNKKG